MKEKLSKESIIYSLENKSFSSASLRSIADSVKAAILRQTDLPTRQEKSLSKIADGLDLLVDAVGLTVKQQYRNAEVLQKVLNCLHGKQTESLMESRRLTHSLNTYRKACGIAFFCESNGHWHRVTLRTRKQQASRYCEFIVETSGTKKSRIGERPRNVFPVLKAIPEKAKWK